tara:strand:+ start:14633 stop:17119 length:2487 start_codon:yes stop_codon:yes gene_type:complete
MAVNIVIKSSKFYNQFKNGINFTGNPSDYTNNLAGSVMENVKLVQQIDVSWLFAASSSNSVASTSLGGGDFLITRQSGNWSDDRFYEGDNFIMTYTNNSGFNQTTGIISSLSGSQMFATGSLPDSSLNGFVNASVVIYGDTDLTSMVYKFGLIDNNANFSITSLVSNNDQGYYGSNIGERILGVRDTNFVTLQRLGSYEDWRTGTMRVKYVSDPNSFTQRFEIEHEFTIVPYYLEGELGNLQNNITPPLLAGLNSLKYVYSPGFRTVLSNPNTEKIKTLENNLGSVAWFNENFNGFNNNYQVNSIIYQDANTLGSADGIIIGSKTKVTIEVQKNTGNFTSGERAGIYISYLPDQDEYQNTTLTDLKDNFLYDNSLNNEGLTPTVGDKSIIENYEISNIVTNTMTLTFDVEYASLQKAFLSNKNSQDDIYFIIGVQLGDVTLISGNSDRVTILADVGTYDESADIPDLIVNPSFNLFPYKEVVGVDTGFTSLVQWNEDGFTMQGSFDLDLNKQAVLNTLEFRLIAENNTTGSFFELDSFVFNVANPIIVSGVQQFNLITTRNYNLESGNQFNDVSLTTGGLAAGLQTYNLRFSQKISWQDWIQNNLVDSIFYDISKPNNNLNDKSSNYSGLNGYTIKLSMFSNLSGVSLLGVGGITDYHLLTPPLNVYDYDLDGNAVPVWSATIETFDPTNLTNLSGAILTGQNTLFKITWVNSSGAVTDLTDFTAIHRIEETDQNGYNIDEVGTLYSYPSNNRVIPKIGFTNLDIFLLAGNVVTECLIDGSQLNSGVGYNLSGKIEVEGTIDPNAKLTSPDNTVKDTSGTVETKVQAI